MPMHRNTIRLSIFAICLILTGCGGGSTKSDGPGSGRVPDLPADAVPRPETRSRYGNGRDIGNGPQYEVFNKTYTVMASGSGYKQSGVASWYGKKFHGNLTSNREVYDMYEMTAAHKTLPLPTYVRVKNLRNNKSVVVRVNDRGPFIDNRIIDLSYAAALKLDMVRDGTSMVEVTAYDFDERKGDRPASVKTSPASPSNSTPTAARNQVFVQVGAFGDRANAARRLALLSQSGINGASVHEDSSSNPSLYRVRIGPVADVIQYDQIVEELAGLGITDPYLISK
jgi:rare lipoprotein A